MKRVSALLLTCTLGEKNRGGRTQSGLWDACPSRPRAGRNISDRSYGCDWDGRRKAPHPSRHTPRHLPPKGKALGGQSPLGHPAGGTGKMHTAPGPAGNRNDQGKLWPRDIRWNFEFCIKTEENLLLTAGGDHGIIRNCGGRGILPFYPMKRPRRRGRGGAPKCSKN